MDQAAMNPIREWPEIISLPGVGTEEGIDGGIKETFRIAASVV